ncbi:hypothetical protein [Pelotomaculum sp. PtaB.Bin117]|nr:hypothetical protein [Pelotomaculum sp. PtaB.Bin117]OPX87130.1 MAG: hypothetical protein A4E54_01793 [Pelotomaculum sp. PtaB.Bin117]OPY62234.1 MAG: hypothetical protein A4E56_01491 [Pelotomaculum sp. PtaU1.Bin065]
MPPLPGAKQKNNAEPMSFGSNVTLAVVVKMDISILIDSNQLYGAKAD